MTRNTARTATLIIAVISLFTSSLSAQSDIVGRAIHLDAAQGSDDNSGAKESPLRTLSEAARRVNEASDEEAISIVLAEGVYAIDKPALFKPTKRSFTRDRRLTVRAAILPDDAAWTPQSMPVLIHTMPLSPTWMGGRPDPFCGVAYGMQFETSHVTVRGLKILGAPHLEQPTPRAIRRVYPIAREGRDLEDLEIKQCLFIGNREVADNHCCILAQGDEIVVDHCVFYGCKITVVYWKGQAKKCAMRHTLAVNNYATGAWICGVADDFDFTHNVMSGNRSAVLFQGPPGKYELKESVFAGNEHLYASGFGPQVNFKALPDSTLALPASSKFVPEKVAIEMDQSKRGYLHVVEGLTAADIGAGLFTKPK